MHSEQIIPTSWLIVGGLVVFGLVLIEIVRSYRDGKWQNVDKGGRE